MPDRMNVCNWAYVARPPLASSAASANVAGWWQADIDCIGRDSDHQRMRSFVLLVAALSTVACSRTSKLLGEMSAPDNALVQAIAGKSNLPRCGLATEDGYVRLIAVGDKAVIDLNGKPTALAKIADNGTAGETFGDNNTSVAVSFVADALAANGDVIGHKAGVMVTSSGGMEHFFGMWTC